jgi:TPP-dependent pyruvate/acetoin dehydrogenase alpha subunit
MQKVTGGRDIAARAAAYGMESALVDGNDLWAVEEAASEAVQRARGEHRPTLLECQTYRHYGHSKSDPATYRPKEEVERWLARDPLTLTRERLLALGAPEADVEAVERDARERMDRAVDDALAGPYPDPAGDRATEFAP